MITSLNVWLDQSRPLHVIPTQARWRASHMAGLLAATVIGAALLGAALGGHNAARADHKAVTGPVSAAVGVIDHSVLNNASQLPEPNAALLHSDPNAYVSLNASGQVLVTMPGPIQPRKL
jgi:hypothetical protein